MFDFKNNIAKIEGWLTKKEGIFLFHTAKKVSSEYVIVEIGSWKGKSTICLAKGTKEGNGAKIYAIDPHVGSSEHHKMFGKVDTYQDFLQNINNAEVKEYIIAIRKKSEEASKDFNKAIGFLFIDGAHDFKSIKNDIKSWFLKVKDGGIIAFHDTWGFIGPNMATAILLLTSTQIKNPKLVDTITYCRKVKKNSFYDRIKNIAFLLYRTLVGWIGTIKLCYKGTVLK